MKILSLLLGLFILMSLSGCDMGPKSGYGFTLPEGDVERGQQAFVQLQCNSCHVVQGNAQIKQSDKPELSIRLGGKVTHIQTYGELVTSIINPSHKLAKGYPVSMITSAPGTSRMKNYNEAMTVNQLVDLVAFLQAQYELKPYDPSYYRPY